MPAPRSRLIAYAAIVFAASALVLVVEIVAARLIAPFVGVSLYSWTAIIGVVLAGLSLGNWLGGVWADRGGAHRAAGITLFAAGLSAFAILLILPRLAEPLQAAELSLAGTSLALATALFFVPATLLGIITPLLTTLALRDAPRPGHIVGLMHALAALGSILGTFATGFWLVQWIGSRNIVLATGVVLVLMALPLLRRGRDLALMALAGVVVTLLTSVAGYADPCQRESNYFCLRVVDSSAEAPFGEARSLVLDHLLHGTNHRQAPELLLAPYLHLMDELMQRQVGERPGARYFFAGGGAYTLPRALRARDPTAWISVAELDPAVTELAGAELYLDASGIEVQHLDARAALLREHGPAFDVVVGDVFHDIAVPYHLLTREFAALVKAHLQSDGLYVMNVVDAFPDARLVKAVHGTLRTVFDEVEVWIDHLPEAPTRVTYVLSARDRGPALPDQLQARQGMPRTWYRVTEPVLASGVPASELPQLSDDFAPVERLLAQLFLGRAGR
jgi:spermidine synthase/MFS family permease